MRFHKQIFFLIFILIITPINGEENQQEEYKACWQDLANHNTFGYKAKKVNSEDIDLSQGTLLNTENNLNIAIAGDGFLKFLTPTGEEVYSRNGELKISKKLQLIDHNGYVLQPEIKFPEEYEKNTLFISQRGEISLANSKGYKEVGKITLFHIKGKGVKRYKSHYYRVEKTVESATPGEKGLGDIHQGFLEMSNLSIISTITRMTYLLHRAKKDQQTNIKSIEFKLYTLDKLFNYLLDYRTREELIQKLTFVNKMLEKSRKESVEDEIVDIQYRTDFGVYSKYIERIKFIDEIIPFLKYDY